jgi:hypothetical protein
MSNQKHHLNTTTMAYGTNYSSMDLVLFQTTPLPFTMPTGVLANGDTGKDPGSIVMHNGDTGKDPGYIVLNNGETGKDPGYMA